MPQVPATQAKLKIQRRILQKCWLIFRFYFFKVLRFVCLCKLCVYSLCFTCQAPSPHTSSHLPPEKHFWLRRNTMIVIMTPVVALVFMVMVTLLYLSWFLTCWATKRTELIAFSRCGSWPSSHCHNPSSQLSQFYFSINVGSFIQVVSRLIGFLLDFAFFPSFIFSFLQICIHLFLNRVAKAAVVPWNVFFLISIWFHLIKGEWCSSRSLNDSHLRAPPFGGFSGNENLSL